MVSGGPKKHRFVGRRESESEANSKLWELGEAPRRDHDDRAWGLGINLRRHLRFGAVERAVAQRESRGVIIHSASSLDVLGVSGRCYDPAGWKIKTTYCLLSSIKVWRTQAEKMGR